MSIARFQKIILGVCALSAMASPLSAYAFGYFGGRQTIVMGSSTCTCLAGVTKNVHFILDDATHQVLKLNFLAARTYEHNSLDSVGGQQLGSYTPGGAPCMVQAAQACTVVTQIDGMYSSAPGTGTSMSMIENTKTFFSKTFRPMMRGIDLSPISYGKA